MRPPLTSCWTAKSQQCPCFLLTPKREDPSQVTKRQLALDRSLTAVIFP